MHCTAAILTLHCGHHFTAKGVIQCRLLIFENCIEYQTSLDSQCKFVARQTSAVLSSSKSPIVKTNWENKVQELYSHTLIKMSSSINYPNQSSCIVIPRFSPLVFHYPCSLSNFNKIYQTIITLSQTSQLSDIQSSFRYGPQDEQAVLWSTFAWRYKRGIKNISLDLTVIT